MSPSTKINDGGPKFPVPDNAEGSGMTLRDWFAGQALAGLIVGAFVPTPEWEWWKRVANRAYAFADAMIAARSKP